MNAATKLLNRTIIHRYRCIRHSILCKSLDFSTSISSVEQGSSSSHDSRTANNGSSNISTPLEKYKKLVANGLVQSDDNQLSTLFHFQNLHNDIMNYESSGRIGAPPRSMYLWGGPGCGKTFLMDMFYDSIPIEKKRRVHFHDFMSETHFRIHEWKMKQPVHDIGHRRKDGSRYVRIAPESDSLVHVYV